jgi:hypothetical protein
MRLHIFLYLIILSVMHLSGLYYPATCSNTVAKSTPFPKNYTSHMTEIIILNMEKYKYLINIGNPGQS